MILAIKILLTVAFLLLFAAIYLHLTTPTIKQIDEQGKRWTDYGEKI